MNHPPRIRVFDKVFEEFLSAQRIQERVAELGAEIRADLADETPLFIGVLNGAFIFAADLVRATSIPCEITFVKLASYRGVHRAEDTIELLGLDREIAGRHIVIVEDIIDSGRTMDLLLRQLRTHGAASLRLATLLVKPTQLEVEIPIDYAGFEIPPHFVIGYGLDYDGYGRELTAIYQLAHS